MFCSTVGRIDANLICYLSSIPNLVDITHAQASVKEAMLYQELEEPVVMF